VKATKEECIKPQKAMIKIKNIRFTKTGEKAPKRNLSIA
jgi:hypothetical protein